MFAEEKSVNKLTIVIPAFNEEKRIGPTISSLLENIQDLKEIIVVFDGKDSTADVCRSFGSRVKVLKYDHKLGKGGAILEGLKAASSEIVGFTDADGSAPWYEVQKLYRMVSKEHPCVIGSRWMDTSNVIKSQPGIRIVLGRVYRHIVLAFLGLEIKDLQCGLKMFDVDLAKSLIPKVRVKDWAFDTSVLYNTKLIGKEIKEVGITWSDSEKTKLRIIRAAPLMFASVIGLRIAHSPRLGKFKYAFDKVSSVLDSSKTNL